MNRTVSLHLAISLDNGHTAKWYRVRPQAATQLTGDF